FLADRVGQEALDVRIVIDDQDLCRHALRSSFQDGIADPEPTPRIDARPARPVSRARSAPEPTQEYQSRVVPQGANDSRRAPILDASQLSMQPLERRHHGPYEPPSKGRPRGRRIMASSHAGK